MFGFKKHVSHSGAFGDGRFCSFFSPGPGGVVTLAFWLLLSACAPSPDEVEDRADGLEAPPPAETEDQDKDPEALVREGKRVIRMIPGEYMPGRRPQGVGERLRELEKLVDEYERLNPDVRVVMQQVGGADLTEGEYIATQIMGGIAPDIVQINAEVVWQDVDKGWWVPFDTYLNEPNAYAEDGGPGSEAWMDVFANKLLTRAKQAPDGRLYSLTYDIVETAIYYNRDIFRRLDLSPPTTWAEFIEIQRKVKDAGMIPIGMTVDHAVDWSQDFFFDQFFYPIIDRLDLREMAPELADYYQGYLFTDELCWGILNETISAEEPRYREMWRVMREWRDYWPRDIVRSNLDRMFLLQRTPMVWSTSGFVRRLMYDPLVDFEWGVFYLPPITKETSPQASGVDPAVIGGSGMQYSVTRTAKKRDEQDPGHLEQVIDFLQFMTLPKNAVPVVNEASLFVPNFAGAELAPELEPFLEIIDKRYTTTKWRDTLDRRWLDRNRRLIELFLGDALSLDEFMTLMDENNRDTARRIADREGWTFEEPHWQ